jgi:hypothetical protein
MARAEDVGLYLLRRGLFVHRESASAHRAHRHRGETALDGVLAPQFQNRRVRGP